MVLTAHTATSRGTSRLVRSNATTVRRERVHRVVESYAAEPGGFYASGINFRQLGLSSSLVDAVYKAGFNKPSHIQSVAVPELLNGSDVAVAAETGSGKTLAYLLPLMDSVLQRQEAMQRDRPDAPEWFRHCALVLCPNLELCEQVVATATRVASARNKTAPPLSAAVVTPRFPPRAGASPDIIVSTPAAFSNFLDESSSAYGPEWDPANVAQRVRHLVADEADFMISSDSFFKPLTSILDLMRATDRDFVGRVVATCTGITEEEFHDLPRKTRMAAFTSGLQGMADERWKLPSGERPDCSLEAAEEVPKDLWVGAPHRCRSYIFVGATFPRHGQKAVAADISKRYKNIRWIEGRHLHASSGQVQHEWIPLETTDPEEVSACVVIAIRDDAAQAAEGEVRHTLVFCRDTASAEAMHAYLIKVGMNPLLYHKKLPPVRRQEALELMRGDESQILVATDAASRGLDIPSVAHIVQADFADSAVDFLHRVGRTARAGRPGKVTSCYTPDKQALVGAIKRNVEEHKSIEGAFSRNRSFSTKLKRYGKYVPRGERGHLPDAAWDQVSPSRNPSRAGL